MKKIMLLLCGLMSGAYGASSSGAASSSGGLVEEIKKIGCMCRLPFDETLQRYVTVFVKAPFMEAFTSDDVVTLLEKNYPETSKSQLELAHVYYDLYRYSDYHKRTDANDYYKQYEKWIALAIAQEDPEAMYVFGGRMIEKNEKKGVALINEAVEKGYPPAQYFRAKLRQHGLLVAKNKEEALRLYLLAAHAGNRSAQHAMATITIRGECGVTRDLFEEKKWLKICNEPNEPGPWYQFEFSQMLGKLKFLYYAEKTEKRAFYSPTVSDFFRNIVYTKEGYEYTLSCGYTKAHEHIDRLETILAKGESRKHNVKFQIIQRPPSVSYAKRHHHAVIGLCPGTSYYTPEVIASYIQWSRKTFTQVTFFIPTGWSIHNYRARGMSEKTSLDRTRKADRQIQSKYFAAFDLIGVPKSVALRLLVLASELEKNPVYQAAYAQCLHQYQTDVGFRGVCRAQTATYMRLSDEGAIEEAVKYLLRELPLFFASSAIFGVPSSYNVYHDIPEFINLTPEGAMQGFIKAEVKEQSSASSSSSSCGD